MYAMKSLIILSDIYQYIVINSTVIQSKQWYLPISYSTSTRLWLLVRKSSSVALWSFTSLDITINIANIITPEWESHLLQTGCDYFTNEGLVSTIVLPNI